MTDQIYLFVFGLILLIKGGDWFVDGATAIARKFHLPELLIGATVVSIGTTLPEVMVSAGGALAGSSGIAYGNAIGSIICNTALIAAVSITVKPGKVDKKSLYLPVIFFTIASVFYALTAYINGHFNVFTGITLLLMFVIYMIFSVLGMKKNNVLTGEELENNENEENNQEKDENIFKSILFLVVGAAIIAIGADLLVTNGTKIAEYLGVPDTVIALTFVALGTSLPELVTAITSLAKGHGLLSLGNVIGANLFNLILVSSIAMTILPFDVPAGTLVGGVASSLVIDIPVMFAVMGILIIPTLIRGKLARWQGIALLAIYAGFCTVQFVL